MDLIADILLVAGAFGAGFYCFILSRRLSRFTDLEKGVGGAVAVLSAQVDDLTKTLQHAQTTANMSTVSLDSLTTEAETLANDIEQVLSVSHDFAPPAPDVQLNPSDEAEATEIPVFRRRVIEEPAA